LFEGPSQRFLFGEGRLGQCTSFSPAVFCNVLFSFSEGEWLFPHPGSPGPPPHCPFLRARGADFMFFVPDQMGGPVTEGSSNWLTLSKTPRVRLTLNSLSCPTPHQGGREFGGHFPDLGKKFWVLRGFLFLDPLGPGKDLFHLWCGSAFWYLVFPFFFK